MAGRGCENLLPVRWMFTVPCWTLGTLAVLTIPYVRILSAPASSVSYAQVNRFFTMTRTMASRAAGGG